ncbi:hypothetical protein VSX64_24295 [Aurantimonas sp. C2-6-R+9]|uniref:hypothetical protein n=1 Tax=unclassified Aurantimonas TaxID=2638230 RepID=UPI002E19EE13|nr:hypothetical protein [Aurantimonas sp. C2-6-R+9]
MKRIDKTHGMHRIVAGRENGTAMAIAYLGRRRVEGAIAESPEEAAEILCSLLDRMREERHGARRDGIPLEEEFADAILALQSRLGEVETAILEAFSRFPEKVWADGDLAAYAGCSEDDAERALQKLGRDLSRMLDFKPPAEDAPDRRSLKVAALAISAESRLANRPGWRARPELAKAIVRNMAWDQSRASRPVLQPTGAIRSQQS